jgi:hypothetical protein
MSSVTVDLMPSRRRVLGSAAMAAIGAMVLLAAGAASAAAPKSAQKSVEYQGHPKAGHSCNTCKNFQPPQNCKVVEGPVEPSGWCDKYTHS